MNTLKLELRKIDLEKMVIRISMTMLEGFGIIALVCGIFGVKLF